MERKLANISIEIPYKRAGNVIYQQPVSFDVYEDDHKYKLVPCLDDDELRIANLPKALEFVVSDNEPVSLRGIRDGNFHVIEDAFNILSEKQLIT